MPHVKSRVVARGSARKFRGKLNATARKVPWKIQDFYRRLWKTPIRVPAKNPVFVVIVEVTGTGC